MSEFQIHCANTARTISQSEIQRAKLVASNKQTQIDKQNGRGRNFTTLGKIKKKMEETKEEVFHSTHPLKEHREIYEEYCNKLFEGSDGQKLLASYLNYMHKVCCKKLRSLRNYSNVNSKISVFFLSFEFEKFSGRRENSQNFCQ